MDATHFSITARESSQSGISNMVTNRDGLSVLIFSGRWLEMRHNVVVNRPCIADILLATLSAELSDFHMFRGVYRSLCSKRRAYPNAILYSTGLLSSYAMCNFPIWFLSSQAPFLSFSLTVAVEPDFSCYSRYALRYQTRLLGARSLHGGGAHMVFMNDCRGSPGTVCMAVVVERRSQCASVILFLPVR